MRGLRDVLICLGCTLSAAGKCPLLKQIKKKKYPLENDSKSRVNGEAGAKAQKFFCRTAMSSVSVDSSYTPLLRECALRQRVFSV